MLPFEVWAPHAQSVDLVLHRLTIGVEPRELAMEKCAEGWWRVEAAAGHGDDYGYRIDGGSALPDPCSPWQPNGVHGLSRYLDHEQFAWSDTGWRPPPLTSGAIYEMHVGTFTPGGCFVTATERLPHLVELGITHVEVMPVNEFSGNHGWGYDGVDLYAVHHSYGGPEAFKRFVNACHAHGLAVILDVVYNHLGPAGNYLEQYGPYFTERYKTPWGKAVNLDGEGSDPVRQFFIDNACMWFRDYHVDGLRLDAVHALLDQSAIHFLEQLAQSTRSLERHLGRPLSLIAESDLNDPRVVTPPELGGYGMDAQWSDDFHHALHVLATGETAGYYGDYRGLADVAKALSKGFVFDGRFAPSRGRRHGRPLHACAADRLLGYIQTHDQIGNRARGERLSALASERMLRVAAALVLTGPFIPMLFQGEEWGATTPFYYFTDHADEELAAAVREGRRSEFASFGWRPEDIPDPQASDTFQASQLDWHERNESTHQETLNWYRQLLRLRRQEQDLTSGKFALVNYDEAAGWLVASRGTIAIIANFSAERRTVELVSPVSEILLASDNTVVPNAQGIEVAAEAVAIVRTLSISA